MNNINPCAPGFSKITYHLVLTTVSNKNVYVKYGGLKEILFLHKIIILHFILLHLKPIVLYFFNQNRKLCLCVNA